MSVGSPSSSTHDVSFVELVVKAGAHVMSAVVELAVQAAAHVTLAVLEVTAADIT